MEALTQVVTKVTALMPPQPCPRFIGINITMQQPTSGHTGKEELRKIAF